MRNPASSWFAILCLLILSGIAQAETLTEKLASEPAEKLVQDARKSGNIIRGAILFHQGNINCAKCHQNSGSSQEIAPNIRTLGDQVSDASLVSSILEPSKAISKGYEALRILTSDGKVLTGLPIKNDDDGVIIRDQQDVDKILAFEADEIEEILPSKTSIMPAGLADELSSRQQFLDLLLYVIDLKERGPAAGQGVEKSTTRRQLSEEMSGLVLIRDLNCTSCHQSAVIDALPAQHLGPNLKWSGKHLNPIYLRQFVSAPHLTKPGTKMPDVLGHLDESSKAMAAEAIVHFLVSIDGNSFSTGRPDTEHDAKRGRELFHSVGCVACHAPRDEDAVEQNISDSVSLGELTKKYDADSLTAFLENPHAARPSGRMPNLQLTHSEAEDLSAYLLLGSADLQLVEAKSFALDADLARQGKQLFKSLNCSACHTGIVKPTSPTLGIPQLARMQLDRGCLSATAGPWPNFHLTATETTTIKSAIQSDIRQLDQQQSIDFTLASFRCTSCHSRNNLGGVSEQRQVHFQSTNLNLGEQGRIPPSLTGVGAKLKKKWMRDVLVNGRSIRPYMKTRMPKYGEANVGHLVDLFQSEDKIPAIEQVELADIREARKSGLQIVGNRGLNCAACHTFQYKLSDTMPAVDLTEMAQRLKKDWFYQYMLNPQKFSPNTVMPSYWPGGKALRSDITGSPKEQIESVWQYLLEGRQARAPAGVIREPLEIVVTDRARILRRKYPQIGKRGIGVGYPGGVNLAYDAQQMRLATIWRGRFVDPAAAWYGQGSGDVRAMGPSIQLAKGPELFDPTQPISGDNDRPADHQFKGYTLDEQGRPTFHYTYDATKVEDSFIEFRDTPSQDTQLRRTITITAAVEVQKLEFRVASSDSISQASQQSYQVGNNLTIKVATDQAAEIADRNLLYLPLVIQPNETQQIVLEYIWK